MEPFIGMIVMFGGNFAPRSWALCDGQLLAISSNSALFSILGTTYGGDGRTTFGLPDLRGRAAIHPGNGPGLSSYRLGEKGGREQVTLTANELPSHTHGLTGLDAEASTGNPTGAQPATARDDIYATSGNGVALGGATAATGGNRSFEIIPPFQCVNYIIALQGTYPSRS